MRLEAQAREDNLHVAAGDFALLETEMDRLAAVLIAARSIS
jgi:hypothetical protein